MGGGGGREKREKNYRQTRKETERQRQRKTQLLMEIGHRKSNCHAADRLTEAGKTR